MGDTIATYDKKGKFLEYRMDLDRKFVTIKAISELMYNDTQEYCNEYHFVKAELPNGEPLILDGRRSKRSLLKKFSMLHRQFGFIGQNIMDNLSLQMSLQAVALLLTL